VFWLAGFWIVVFWFLVLEFLVAGNGLEMLRLRDGRCRGAAWNFGSDFGLATVFNAALKGL